MTKPPQKRERATGIVNDIAVTFANRVVPRMKRQRNIFCLQNRDGIPDKRVDAKSNAFGGNAAFCEEMGHLSDRMHAGIGSPGSQQHGLFKRDGLNGRRDYRLNGQAIRLFLPTDEVCPVISQFESDVAHGGDSLRPVGLYVSRMLSNRVDCLQFELSFVFFVPAHSSYLLQNSREKRGLSNSLCSARWLHVDPSSN